MIGRRTITRNVARIPLRHRTSGRAHRVHDVAAQASSHSFKCVELGAPLAVCTTGN